MSHIQSSSLLAAAAAPVLLYTAVRWLLRPRPLPEIPVHPGAIPLFGHSLSLLRHVIKNGNISGWWAQVMDASDGQKVVQVMITFIYPV